MRKPSPNGTWIRNFEQFFEHQEEVELIQRWAQFYVLQIIRFFANTLASVESAAHQEKLETVPYFSEQFAIFYNDDAYFKRRKTWKA